MIQINNLVKKFDDFTALDGVNMNVEKGAVYGLVGPNGAGKSTLIRHITGVMRQDAGEVFIEGEPVYENARIKGHMACIIIRECIQILMRSSFTGCRSFFHL